MSDLHSVTYGYGTLLDADGAGNGYAGDYRRKRAAKSPDAAGDMYAGRRMAGDPDGPNGRIVRAVEAIRPDAVLIGGDMIVSSGARAEERGWMDVAIDLMRRLSDRFPVYLAEGNHEAQLANPEFRGRYLALYQAYYEATERAGAIRLHNSSADPFPMPLKSGEKGLTNDPADSTRPCGGDSLRLWGLDLDCITYEKWMNYPLRVSEIEEKIGRADPSRFNIVMAHNPKYFPVYAAWGADLVLSGHIHGGILRFPNGRGLLSPDWKLFPPYTAGEYHEGDSTMILTAGIGTHTVPIRINNPPDICRIDLLPENRQ